MTTIALNKINGILLLDKPIKLSSNQALQRVKRLFLAKKAGHTGSLDPLATGMLPICFGEATKFSQFLLESDKQYEVSMQLGVKTTTGDAEGEVINTQSFAQVGLKQIEAVLPQFTGTIQQIPPMYSAIKYQGKPLYRLARAGISIEREPRTVHIHQLSLIYFKDDILILNVHCSKGTYIRTLVEDIGDQLGCGAHVNALRRIAVKPYYPMKMYTLDYLEEINRDQGIKTLQQYLLPLESSVQSFPAVHLSTSAAFYLRAGQSVMVPHLPTHGLVRLYINDSQFLGIGEIQDDGRVTPKRLILA